LIPQRAGSLLKPYPQRRTHSPSAFDRGLNRTTNGPHYCKRATDGDSKVLARPGSKPLYPKKDLADALGHARFQRRRPTRTNKSL
jgi:hypothetical protein